MISNKVTDQLRHVREWASSIQGISTIFDLNNCEFARFIVKKINFLFVTYIDK